MRGMEAAILSPCRLLRGASFALWAAILPLAVSAGPVPKPGDHAVTVEAGRTRKICQVVGETDLETGVRTVNATRTRYGFWGTDLGASFEHDGDLYFLFGDTHAVPGLKRPRDADLVAVSRDRDPEDCLEMSFLESEDGKYRPLAIPGVTLAEFSVPTGGLSLGGEMHVFATTDSTPDSPMGRSVLASSGDGGRTFRFRHTVSTGRFINISPQVVDAAAVPGLPQRRGEAVLLWGSGRYRRSDPYLAVVPADSFGSGSGTRYFAGTDPAGSPRWSGAEADAAPLFRSGCLGELSVGWNPYLDRWLMLYNCGTPNNRIYLRSAERPWGPWSEARILFDPDRDGGYCRFMNPAPRLFAVGGSVPPCRQVSDPHSRVPGDAYAPYLISRFTKGELGRSSDIYYLMSTWNPYTVVLMRSTLKLGEAPSGALEIGF
jgi:Domain of unknown function (DUF4185)